jgi:hypothetical protein
MFVNEKGNMRKIIVVFTILLMGSVWLSVAQASIARGGGGARPAVGNRSGGANINRGNINRGNIDRGNINRGNINRGNINRGNIDRSNINRGNVNRGNVNARVNNANINRNVDVHGWGNHNWVDDNHWGWGSFAGGAAAAATGAAVGAAVANRHEDNVAVVAPAAGTVVSTLPEGCSPANTETAQYSCGGVNYQPSYDGSNLVYQAVEQP